MSQLLDALVGVPNAREPVSGLVTGGQPSLDHLARLKRAGCEVVIDFRDPMEPQPFKTPDAVRAAGLEYRNIPVGHGTIAAATFAAILAAARELAGKKRAFVYCSSGNRVGVGLIPYFIVEQGMGEEEAIEQAMAMGMRSADLMEQALTYARGLKKD